MEQTKDYCVFSQTMAGFLMMNGCKLKKMSVSKRDSNKFVYFFPSTDYVLECAERYIENRK